jgi:hypothetical protein
LYACSNLTFCIMYLSFRLVQTRPLLGTTIRQIHRHRRFPFFHFKYIMSEQPHVSSLFLRKRLVLTNRMTPVSYIIKTITKDAKRFRTSPVGGLFEKKTSPDLPSRLDFWLVFFPVVCSPGDFPYLYLFFCLFYLNFFVVIVKDS